MVPRILILNLIKMEKYYLTNGKEVKVGDTISDVKTFIHPMLGEINVTECIVVTEDTLPILEQAGVVLKYDKDKKNTNEVPMELNYYIEKIAKRLNWKVEKVYNYLNNVDTILPAAAFSMVLREIAIELDKKYTDHIQDSPEIYVISLFDGRITKANKAHIKNYKNFAAFRSVDDARIACKITKDILKEMFSGSK